MNFYPWPEHFRTIEQKHTPSTSPPYWNSSFCPWRKTAHLSKAIYSWADLQSSYPLLFLRESRSAPQVGAPKIGSASLHSQHNTPDTELNEGHPQPKGNSSLWFLLTSPGAPDFLSGDSCLLENPALYKTFIGHCQPKHNLAKRHQKKKKDLDLEIIIMAKWHAAGDIWTDNANWYPLQLYYVKYDMFQS